MSPALGRSDGLPPVPTPPIRDPGGWGVAPAPDGRGTPEPPVTALLTEHRAQLDSLASALFAAETLDAPAAYAAASVAPRVPVDQTEPFEPVVRAT